MLTLNDGRSELWQWDTGRKLTVDAECSQVHFSNKVFGRSIDLDVVNGVASIPDILLQTDKDLNVWAFVGTAENGYTKISKTFKVNRRNKPADYVFTQPDQTSLEEIKEKIEYLESIQDPDAIKNAVEDYLEQNPVEAPVQSVNGKTGEVELTSEDVGAISQDDLQKATNEALAQAKASGEFDGQPGKDGKDGRDGYTPQKNVDYFDGKDGKNGENGKDYVLTEADKQEIAEQAAELVEIPEGSGGGIAVTGAIVGQTVKIAAVDENGVPTAWEPVDLPSGEEWENLAEMTLDEDGIPFVDIGDVCANFQKLRFTIVLPSMTPTSITWTTAPAATVNMCYDIYTGSVGNANNPYSLFIELEPLVTDKISKLGVVGGTVPGTKALLSRIDYIYSTYDTGRLRDNRYFGARTAVPSGTTITIQGVKA